MWNQIRTATLMLAVMTVLTGVVYPLAVTGLGQTFFRQRAGGSLLERGGVVVGSELIGQAFSSPAYFWSRPSATTPAYNAAASAGANLGPTNPALHDRVAATVAVLRAAHGERDAIPVDLATASSSGLDPDISPAAALYQVRRVAQARRLPEETVRRLVQEHVEGRQLGFFGEPRVNVLLLNLALDDVSAPQPGRGAIETTSVSTAD
jgi:K+-transporting ATPase ATPase C chain